MVITHDQADDARHPQAYPDDEKVRMLDAAEVAERLGGDYTAATIKRRYRAWGLTAYRLGRQLRWKETDVCDWIEKQRVN